MGNLTFFPNNYEGYIQLGKNDYDSGNFEGALENFEAAYDLEENFEANYLMVSTLVTLHSFGKALKIANEMRSGYLNNENIQLYIHILLGNKQFLESRRTLFFLNRKLTDDLVEKLLIEIECAENHFIQFESQTIKNMLKKIEHFTDEHGRQQMALLTEIQKLPKACYETAAQKLVLSKCLPRPVKASIIEMLLQINSTVTIQYDTLDGKIVDLIPTRLPLIKEQDVMKHLLCELDEQACQENDQMKEILRQELALQVAVLYPFATETIKDVSNWIQLLIQDIGSHNKEKNYEQQNSEEVLYQKVVRMVREFIL